MWVKGGFCRDLKLCSTFAALAKDIPVSLTNNFFADEKNKSRKKVVYLGGEQDFEMV